MPRREPKHYATLARSFSTNELKAMGFRQDGSSLVRRGAGRVLLAEATSLDQVRWRVKPYARHWR